MRGRAYSDPLITLAVAQSLDYLLFAAADIVIPDAVLREAIAMPVT